MTSRLKGSASAAFTGLFIWMLFVIPFSISAIEITFPLLLAAWLFAFRWPWGAPGRSLLSAPEKGLLSVLLLYVILCTASVTTSHFLRITARGLVGKLYEYTLLFLIALFAARQPAAAKGSAWALVLAAWLVVLHSLIQEWIIVRSPVTTIRDPLSGHMLDYLRMVGPYKNPNDLATYLMVVGLLLISLVFFSGHRFSPGRSFLLVGVLGCLIWTQSFAALLGLWVGISLLIFFNRRDRASVTALLMLAAVATAFFLFIGREHLRGIVTLSDISSKDRTVMWNTAWAMIRANPLWGVGYNTFMANYEYYTSSHSGWPAYAHNCYLQIAAENGLTGLAVFLGFLFLFLRTCIRAIRKVLQGNSADSPDGPFLIGLFAGLCAFLVQSAFDTNLYALRQAIFFWTLAGFAAGLSGSILNDRCANRRAGS